MSENTVAFPAKARPLRSRVSGAEVWAMKGRLRQEHSEEQVDAKVHAICPWLRRSDDDPRCRQCPQWEDDGHHGKGQRLCYGLAEEVVAMSLYSGGAA